MWLQKHHHYDKKDGVHGIVAVAIDSEKGSQNAVKWTIEHLLTRGSHVVLIHVKHKPSSLSPSVSLVNPRANGIAEHALVFKDPDKHTREIFHPYLVFCARKDIHCKDTVIEDVDVAKALIEYASQCAIEHLVIGSSNKGGFLRRFKIADIPGTVSKGAPDFCTVYVVGKGKIQSMRSASRAAPTFSPLQNQLTQPKPRLPLANSAKGLKASLLKHHPVYHKMDQTPSVNGIWQHVMVDEDDDEDDEQPPHSDDHVEEVAPQAPVPYDGQMFSQIMTDIHDLQQGFHNLRVNMHRRLDYLQMNMCTRFDKVHDQIHSVERKINDFHNTYQ